MLRNEAQRKFAWVIRGSMALKIVAIGILLLVLKALGVF